MIEVIVRPGGVIDVVSDKLPGPKGRTGDKGDRGDKGDTGDVTPAATAARVAAENAQIEAQAARDIAINNRTASETAQGAAIAARDIAIINRAASENAQIAAIAARNEAQAFSLTVQVSTAQFQALTARVTALEAGAPPVTPPTLATLGLSATSFTVGTPSSGTITGATAGSTIVATGKPTGFTIDSAARTWAYDGTGSASSGTIVLTETLAGATGSPKATNINYSAAAAPVSPPINSVAPSISGTAQEGQTLSANTGAWSGSPTYAYQWRRGGTAISGANGASHVLVTADVGATITVTVTCTNAGGSTSATSAATATIIAATAGTPLPAPSLTRTSANTTLPATFSFDRTLLADGTQAVMRRSATDDMASPTESAVLTVNAATSSYNFGLGGTAGYFQLGLWAGGARPASLNWSPVVGVNDTAVPLITSSASRVAYQNIAGSFTVASNKVGTLAIVGGANQEKFSVAGANLLLEAQSASGNYVVDIRWTSAAGVPSAIQTITIDNRVNTAAPFDLGANVTGASRNTAYFAPNVIPVSGLAPGTSVAWSLTNGFTAQKNGAGAVTSSGTVTNTDTLSVGLMTGASYSTVYATDLTIGSTTDSWQISVMADPTSVSFAVPASQPAMGVPDGVMQNWVADFTVGAFAIVYLEPLIFRVLQSVVLIGAGASDADINLVRRFQETTGSYVQEVWACPDNQPIVNGTARTVRAIYNAGTGSQGILVGSLIGATNTLVEAQSSVGFPTNMDPATTAAITVPAGGVGVCFGFLNPGAVRAAATTGTKIATGINYGGTDIRGIISRQVVAGPWAPTFAPTDGGGCGMVALAWGA